MSLEHFLQQVDSLVRNIKIFFLALLIKNVNMAWVCTFNHNVVGTP